MRDGHSVAAEAHFANGEGIMGDDLKKQRNEWGHFFLVILLLPLIPVFYFCSVVGMSILTLIMRNSTVQRLSDHHPNAFLNFAIGLPFLIAAAIVVYFASLK